MHEAEDRPAWISEAEEVIGRVKDVLGVRVLTRAGEIAEIHVMARNGRPPRQIGVVIFEFGAPVAADGKFDAGAGGPAELILTGRRDNRARGIVDVDMAVPPGEAAAGKTPPQPAFATAQVLTALPENAHDDGFQQSGCQ